MIYGQWTNPDSLAAALAGDQQTTLPDGAAPVDAAVHCDASTYRQAGVEIGSYFCAHDTSGPSPVGEVEWSYTPSSIGGFAQWPNNNVDTLMTWWQTDSGPTTSG